MMRLFILILLGWCSTASAQLLDLRSDQTRVTADLNQDQRIEQRLGPLRIPDTPDAIQNAELRDHQGRGIKFRMLADPDAGIIIGTHRDDLTLELIGQVTPQGSPQFILTGRQDERLIQLRADDLMVTDLSYGRHCVDLTPVTEGGVPLNVQVALDVSGSMEGFRGDIATSLRSFLELVPPEAQCQVQLFDDDRYFLSAPQADGSPLTLSRNASPPALCSAFNDERVMQAIDSVGGGGTEIVAALTPLFQEVLKRRDASNLMLVISDGAGSAHRSSAAFQALKHLRDTAVEMANAYTLVKWLGG